MLLSTHGPPFSTQLFVPVEMASVISASPGFRLDLALGALAEQRVGWRKERKAGVFGLSTKAHGSCRVVLSAQPYESGLCSCSLLSPLGLGRATRPPCCPLAGVRPCPLLFSLYPAHVLAKRRFFFIKFSPNNPDLSQQSSSRLPRS